MHIRTLAFLAALITLGGLMPPRASSQPYRLVCSYSDEPRASEFLVSDDGAVVTHTLDLACWTDCRYVSVSPDGRFVTFSGGAPSSTQSPHYFIHSNGDFEDSHAIETRPFESVAYDVAHNLLFAYQTPYESKRIDYSAQAVEDTGYSVELYEGEPEFGFSAYYGGLILPDPLERYLIGVKTSPTGEFGPVSDRFYFTGTSNEDMTISSDGRFIAILGNGDPQLTIVRIEPDGQFHEVQSMFTIEQDLRNAYRVRYTPDGRHLMVLFDRRDYLLSMAVDQTTGAVTEVDHASQDVDLLGGIAGGGLAITPDSRYVVTVSGNWDGVEQSFVVFRLNDDGTLTRVTQERHDFPGWMSDVDFIPPYREPVTAASTGWIFYQ